jgi:hypothetical protein
MISFREMLDSVSRLAEILKTTPETESTFRRSVAGLTDLRTMLEGSRLRQFKTPAEVADYVERVAVHQLNGIRESLEVTTASHFGKMRTATELAGRLELRLQALSEGTDDGFLG